MYKEVKFTILTFEFSETKSFDIFLAYEQIVNMHKINIFIDILLHFTHVTPKMFKCQTMHISTRIYVNYFSNYSKDAVQ